MFLLGHGGGIYVKLRGRIIHTQSMVNLDRSAIITFDGLGRSANIGLGWSEESDFALLQSCLARNSQHSHCFFTGSPFVHYIVICFSKMRNDFIQ